MHTIQVDERQINTLNMLHLEGGPLHETHWRPRSMAGSPSTRDPTGPSYLSSLIDYYLGNLRLRPSSANTSRRGCGYRSSMIGCHFDKCFPLRTKFTEVIQNTDFEPHEGALCTRRRLHTTRRRTNTRMSERPNTRQLCEGCLMSTVSCARSCIVP